MSRNCYSNGKYVLSPVEDFSVFTGFSCCGEGENDRDLDDFIHNDAQRHLCDKMAITYGVFLHGLMEYPLAFFTLQNDALKIESPGYPYKTPPAVKIGRFGVRVEFQSEGIGSTILAMVKNFMCQDNRTGCRYITLDAYNKPRVLRFYEKNGFAFLKTPSPQRKQELMYFDLLSHVLLESA